MKKRASIIILAALLSSPLWGRAIAAPPFQQTGKVNATSGSGAVCKRSVIGLVSIDRPGTVRTLAGSDSGNTDGTGAAAQFHQPGGIVVGYGSILYVADSGNARIRKVTPGGVVTTFAGSEMGYKDGRSLDARFEYPRGIAMDGDGNLYVTDTNRIRKVAPDGTVSTLAGDDERGNTDGKGQAARFSNPAGIAVDTEGVMYVADQANHRIRRITPDGIVSTLAGGGNSGHVNATGRAARFHSPEGIAVDYEGNLFVADTGNKCIRKITPSGVVTTVAGMSGVPSGFQNGKGGEARFDQPRGIAVGKNDILFVADTGNHRLRKVTAAGDVSTFAGSGFSGNEDGTLGDAKFNSPVAITLDRTGAAYVVDESAHLLRKVVPMTVMVPNLAQDATNQAGSEPPVKLPRTWKDLPGDLEALDRGDDMTPTQRTLAEAKADYKRFFEQWETGEFEHIELWSDSIKKHKYEEEPWNLDPVAVAARPMFEAARKRVVELADHLEEWMPLLEPIIHGYGSTVNMLENYREGKDPDDARAALRDAQKLRDAINKALQAKVDEAVVIAPSGKKRLNLGELKVKTGEYLKEATDANAAIKAAFEKKWERYTKLLSGDKLNLFKGWVSIESYDYTTAITHGGRVIKTPEEFARATVWYWVTVDRSGIIPIARVQGYKFDGMKKIGVYYHEIVGETTPVGSAFP